MVERAMNAYRNALVWWVEAVQRRAGSVLLAAATVTAAAINKIGVMTLPIA